MDVCDWDLGGQDSSSSKIKTGLGHTEYLLSKCEALASIPGIEKKTKKEKVWFCRKLNA